LPLLGGHHVNMDISVKRIFQNLKRDHLIINTKAMSISSTAPPTVAELEKNQGGCACLVVVGA
jgi:hypothetical protein